MKSFNEIYEEIYKQNIDKLELLRKSKIKKFFIAMILAIIVIILAIQISAFFLPYILIIIMMILIFSMAFGNSKYKKTFKQTVIATLVKNIDENLNYYPEGKIGSVLYRQAEFESYDNYYSEDTIEGILDRKYAVKMAEVHTENESTDSNGNTHKNTIFHGMFGYIVK